jgi:S1-C subfamily serine protease
MQRVWSKTGMFATGMLAAILVIVVLMAAGVIPLKSQTRVIERQSAAAAGGATTQTVAATTRSLTPAEIYDRASPGVVEVLATFTQAADPTYGMGGGTAQALGSGFVASTDGTILTNAHVVTDNGTRASSVSVVFKVQKGGKTETTEVPAAIVGSDETSDVAVLKVDPTKAPSLRPLELGDSSSVEVGEAVVAIGNPLGYDFSVTSGIVSATNRNLESPNGSVIADGIQTDAAINEGNSGGPLIDSSGKVIGINEQIASQSGGNQGLGFAVPIDTARDVMDQIETKGSVSYSYLGIQGQTLTADVAKALGIGATDGVLVAQVEASSPAAEAGLRGGTSQVTLQQQMYVLGGDVITALDGETVDSMEDFVAALNTRDPGDTIKLTVLRDGRTVQLEATLAERSSS